MRWLNVGDLHLEKLERLFGDKGVSMQLKQLRNQLSYARDNSISNVVVLGDIFDTPFPKQSTVISLCEVIHEFRDMSWWVILGNHDIHNTDVNSSPFLSHLSNKYLPNLRIYHDPGFAKIEGIRCHFLPWPAYISKDDKPHIVFTHTEFFGAARDSGMISKDGPKLKPRSGKYVISGHLHTQQELDNLYYPGTAFPFSFGDTQNKSFTVSSAVLKDTGLFVKHTRVAIDPIWKFVTVEVNSPEDLKKIPESPDGNFYRLKMNNSSVRLPEGWLATRKHVKKFVSSMSVSAATINQQSSSIPDMIRNSIGDSLRDSEYRKAALRLLEQGFKEIDG